jgi:Kazal-type serine protease inhibitor domain
MRRTVARLLLSLPLLLLPALPMLGEPAQPAGTCMTNEQCSEKEFCAKLYDRCGQSGKCEERPADCTERGKLLMRPVCGCDDKTYDNACLAAAAGTSVKREGKCPA